MLLISEGIDNLRVFEVPCGIWADGGYVGNPRTALVRWRSSWNDKYYQVYVNGRYAGTTFDSRQRQMIVQIPTSFDSPVRIEVFAIELEQAGMDLSGEVESPACRSGRVRINMLRGQGLPVGVGRGSFARGQFGSDADAIEWTSPELDAGIYKFAVKVVDESGNESNSSETGLVMVLPAARPAEQIRISSFDKQTNELV